MAPVSSLCRPSSPTILLLSPPPPFATPLCVATVATSTFVKGRHRRWERRRKTFVQRSQPGVPDHLHLSLHFFFSFFMTFCLQSTIITSWRVYVSTRIKLAIWRLVALACSTMSLVSGSFSSFFRVLGLCFSFVDWRILLELLGLLGFVLYLFFFVSFSKGILKA